MGKEESRGRDDGIISIGIALFNEKDLKRGIFFRESTCNDTTCRTTYSSQLMASQRQRVRTTDNNDIDFVWSYS